MTKRTICTLVVIGGTALSVALLKFAGVLTQPLARPSVLTILAQMIFWATISAAITIARAPGKWSEPIDLSAEKARKLPRWAWPLLFVTLAVANYLIAIAVLLGMASFSPRAKNTTAT